MPRPRLLVSVRSAAEARAALAGGAQIIDVKEPARGALGRAEPAVWQDVVDAVGRKVPVTVALGELCQPLRPITLCPPQGVWLLKIGLAGCCDTAWQNASDALRSKLICQDSSGGDANTPGWVAVAYADWRRAAAPEPCEVARFAIEHRCAALLVDTWKKDGTSLLDWLDLEEITRLIAPLRQHAILTALAGSLRGEHIDRLLPLVPDVIAVRGAACRSSRRRNHIDTHAVRELASLLQSSHRRPARRVILERDS